MECFEHAINYHVDNNQFSQAAKLYAEIAELFAAEHNAEGAIDFYYKSSDCWNNSNSATCVFVFSSNFNGTFSCFHYFLVHDQECQCMSS